MKCKSSAHNDELSWIQTSLAGSEVRSFVGTLVGSDVGVDIFGNVDGHHVWESCFLIVENLLLICTVIVDCTNCANSVYLVNFSEQIGKAKCWAPPLKNLHTHALKTSP